MSRALRLSPALSLPIDVAGEAIAVLATRGAGKSYCSAVLIEELYCAGVQLVVIDVTGVYWGLRSTAKGLPDGLPVTILGGAHGDVPLEETAGKLIADLIVDTRQSLVLDLSDFDSKAAQIRFMTDFAERLYRRKARSRTTLHMVVDEADEFAPQRPQKNETRLLGAMETLVRRGRSRGIGMTLITQRSASIAKGVLDMVETVIIMRMLDPRSRAAIEGWIHHKSLDDRAGVLDSLPALPTGTAWVWSPLRDILEKTAIRRIDTFDSYVTPKPGVARIDPKGLAAVDIAKLGEQIKATVERAKQDDPAALRREIAELRKAVVPVADVTELKAAERQGYDRGLSIGTKRALLIAKTALVSTIDKVISDYDREAPVKIDNEPVNHAFLFAEIRKPTIRARSEPAGSLGKAERSILTAMVQSGGAASKKKVALMAGYAHSGGAFNNALGTLRTAGLIGRGEPIRITDAGSKAVPDAEPLPEGSALIAYWRTQLPKAESSILLALSQGLNGLGKARIAEATGYEASGGGFNNALGRLRTLGLVNRGDPISLSEEIFN